jgi:hypothetical protein
MIPGSVKSRFQHLVVSGCSFTSNLFVPDNSPFAWPNMISYWSGMTIDNLAIPGAGNNHIARSIILHLEKTKPDPEKTLVLAMWSGPARIDWITEKSLSQFAKEYPFAYQYTEHTELSLGGHWWNSRASPVIKAIREYAKLQDQNSFAVDSWLAMTQLSDYLTTRGYTFYYTSYFSYNNVDAQNDALNYNYRAALARAGLTLDKQPWIQLAENDHYGDWSRLNNRLTEDNYHPGKDANIIWTRDVLLPALQQLGAVEKITK